MCVMKILSWVIFNILWSFQVTYVPNLSISISLKLPYSALEDHVRLVIKMQSSGERGQLQPKAIGCHLICQYPSIKAIGFQKQLIRQYLSVLHNLFIEKFWIATSDFLTYGKIECAHKKLVYARIKVQVLMLLERCCFTAGCPFSKTHFNSLSVLLHHSPILNSFSYLANTNYACAHTS